MDDIEALRGVLEALEPLGVADRHRVLGYARERYNGHHDGLKYLDTAVQIIKIANEMQAAVKEHRAGTKQPRHVDGVLWAKVLNDSRYTHLLAEFDEIAPR